MPAKSACRSPRTRRRCGSSPRCPPTCGSGSRPADGTAPMMARTPATTPTTRRHDRPCRGGSRFGGPNIDAASNATSGESAGQLPIESPNDRRPLGFIAAQLLILRPLDGGDSLVLRYAACNRLLNGVADIHQHLSITQKLFPGLLGVRGKGTMSRHEDICIEACGRLHGLQPVEAVAIAHE